MDPPSAFELDYSAPLAEDSTSIRARVENARNRAAVRLRDTNWKKNSEIPSSAIRELFPLKDAANRRLNHYLANSRTSARGVDRIARISWTIADLKDREHPNVEDVEVAIALREAGGRWLI